jgi:hypothetical protein
LFVGTMLVVMPYSKTAPASVGVHAE